MSLRIYNTLTRQKEEFLPLAAGPVRMYVCGITPYDLSHIGHARSALVFDVIYRYLRDYRRYAVTLVKNFTDVEDKIIARAAQLGVSPQALAEEHIRGYQADMDKLGILRPDVEPRATRHIPEMIALIERLAAAGVAYVVDGDVYFEVRRFPAYGRLSGKNLDELLAGARVEVDQRKRDPRDFALWKSAKPGEPQWPSPWGPGRPGWHIECSAMSMRYLGETFDIHGGGEDLVFPHHECEIAQSEAVTGKPFARYWVHNGFVNLGAEKMSKSLGNVLTIRSLLERHDPWAIRLYLLRTHYRHPVEFSEERLREEVKPLDRLRGLVDEAARLVPTGPGTDAELEGQLGAARARFEAAMDDDFATPQALAALFDLSRALHAYLGLVQRGDRPAQPFTQGVAALREMAGALGPELEGRVFAPAGAGAWVAGVERLVQERDEARKRRDWRRADAIRAQLEGQGVTLEDGPSGTRWKRGSIPTER
ncbi:MAG: cysteine--tRNA ligase [Candidatus Rokubacteria bacterium]|nr:cysteine--tRNA ligase [Candidatus Rokubacteria bacterium]